MSKSGYVLCNACEAKYVEPNFDGVLGTSRCEKHGLGSFNDEGLKEFCSGCAEDNNQCQICLNPLIEE